MKPPSKQVNRERRQHAWHSHAYPYSRRPLFSPGVVAGLGFCFVLVLVLVYPRHPLERRLADIYQGKKTDQLAVGYLEAFLSADPGSSSLRADLARQLARMGSFQMARDILSPLRQSNDPYWQFEAAWVDLDILEQEAYSIQNNAELRQEKSDRVRHTIVQILQLRLTPEQLLQLGKKSLGIGDVSTAIVIFERLAADSPSLDAENYADAARRVLELSAYQAAADLYFLAMQQSKALAERRKYFANAVRTLLSGSLFDMVIPAADKHIGLLANDREILLFLIEVANAANRPDAAQRYALRLLRVSLLDKGLDENRIRHASITRAATGPHSTNVRYLRLVATAEAPSQDAGDAAHRLLALPFDEQAYTAAFNAFLGNRNIQDARLVAETAVDRKPQDAVWRRRLAEVSEWNNLPSAAMPHWLEYARMTGDETGWDAVLRLAEALADNATLKIALQHKLDREPANEVFLTKMAQLQGRTTSADRLLALPYDERVYLAAFQTFLANSNLKDALLVAQAAVRQRPQDPLWRRRLAEVSEWNNLPRAALPHWLAYARLTNNDGGWDAVLRLAEGLADTETLKTALRHKLDRNPGNSKWLLRLAQLHADTGDADVAIALLRSRLLSSAASTTDLKSRRDAIELLIALTERTGRSDDALSALQQLQREFGPSSAYALRIASMLYQRDNITQAFDAIEHAASVAAPGDTEYWRNYAQLAQLVRNEPAAIKAYQHLLGAETWEEGDLLNLEGLLQEKHPLAASRVAAFGFAKTANTRFAVIALSHFTRLADWAGARLLLERIPPGTMTDLEQDPAFLVIRASIAQANGHAQEAVRDLGSAVQLRPADMQYRAALLWGLIAAKNTEYLKRALRQWAHDAETAPELWGPFAAACMQLNRQADALHWYRKRGFPRNDYLWLMSHAEALEATSQSELAWRIRRHAWLDLRRPEVLAKANPEHLKQLRNRFASMAPLFMNGDDAQRVVQTLLRADIVKLAQMVPADSAPSSGAELLKTLASLSALPPSTTTTAAASAATAMRTGDADVTMDSLFRQGTGERPQDDARLSAGAREVALAYAMSNEDSDLARAWLATRFAGQLAKPLWAEFSLMLVADNRQELNRLLDDLPDWLPMLDRIEAARRAGRPALAETFAFEQLEHLPTNDPLHSRFQELVTARPPTVELDTRRQRQSPLTTTRTDLRVTTRLDQGTDLVAQVVHQKHSSTDPLQLPNVPRNDRELWLIVRRPTDTGFVSAGLLHRDADVSTNGIQFETRFAPTSKMTVSGTAGFNLPAPESALLRVGGMRTGVQGSAHYRFTRTEYGRLTLGWQRYESQAGTSLGTGKNWAVEAGTHLRTEYPNITARAYVSGISTTVTGKSDMQIARLAPAGSDLSTFRFVPDGDTVAGVSVGAGTVVDTNYTRAWRPFVEAGVTYSRVAGAGVNAMAGVAGSVFGSDVLRLKVARVSGTAANPGGFHEIGVDYKWYF